MFIDDEAQLPNTVWYDLVKYRDSYVCQWCGADSGRMTAHHINGVGGEGSSGRNRVGGDNRLSNGITLCSRCHNNHHRSWESRTAQQKSHWKGKKRGPWSDERKLAKSEQMTGREPWNKGKKVPREPVDCPNCGRSCQGKQGLAMHQRHCG